MTKIGVCEACGYVSSDVHCIHCGDSLKLAYLATPEEGLVLSAMALLPEHTINRIWFRENDRRLREAVKAERYRRDTERMRQEQQR